MYWWGGSPNSSGGGEGGMTPDGSLWGTLNLGESTYRYVCRRDELVEFRPV